MINYYFMDILSGCMLLNDFDFIIFRIYPYFTHYDTQFIPQCSVYYIVPHSQSLRYLIGTEISSASGFYSHYLVESVKILLKFNPSYSF